MSRKTRKSGKLVCGWGINDVDYTVINRSETVGGKKKIKYCPYYSRWLGMITRCFNPKCHKRQPTYKDCTICEDWKYFSNFIKWVDEQPNKDWINCQPDKDLLVQGNKHYSPETVVFVSKRVNSFITDRNKHRGQYMLGVSYKPKLNVKPYQAKCNDLFTGGQGYLGIFPTELEAHKAWQAKKHEHACKLADLQEDGRVAKALRERYAPDKDWTNK